MTPEMLRKLKNDAPNATFSKEATEQLSLYPRETPATIRARFRLLTPSEVQEMGDEEWMINRKDFAFYIRYKTPNVEILTVIIQP